MLNLKGTHGTCASYARAIEMKGTWIETEQGVAGRGVYFWAFNTYPEVARRLAMSWWHQSRARGLYSASADQSCAVIHVEINVADEVYLDFTVPEFEDHLLRAVDAASVQGKQLDHGTLYKIYEYLVEKLESKLGITFEVVKTRVSPPKHFKQKIVVGNPSCYIVRTNCKNIELECVEIVSDDEHILI